MAKNGKRLTLCFLGEAGSIHMQRWVNFFAKQGHSVHLASFVHPSSGLLPSVQFHHLKHSIHLNLPGLSYPLNLIPDTLALRRLFSRIMPDLAHAHEAVNYGRLAAFSGFRPLVITPWGTDIFIKSKRGIQKRITQLALKRADLITSDGWNTRDAMVDNLGIAKRAIEMIRFGVDTKAFCRLQKNRALQEKLRIPKEAPVVISLRSLARSHGVLTLVEAIPRILSIFPDAVFIIVGDAHYDPPYMERIRASVKTAGIGKSIRFTGKLPARDLPKYLNLADAYVATSLSDSGLSSSSAEAMACELPVVLSDSGDNARWIAKTGGGYVFPLHDEITLAGHIISVLRDASARDTMGTRNRREILEFNDYETEMKKMESLYFQFANHGKS